MPAQLTEVEDARALVLAQTPALDSEDVPVSEGLGRVLAEPVTSPEEIPGFDNSAMDGYAVRAADLAGATSGSPVTLQLAGESRAGTPAENALASGQAFQISTGAVVPDGADAVVRVEDIDSADGHVRVAVAVERGANIRRAGEDVHRGDTVLSPGTVLGAAELGVLASVGRATVACARRPRVSILSTGDELLAPDEPMRPGGVRNSNAYTVPALAELAGGEVVASRRVRDDRAATVEALAEALDSDVAVICGGVSVGDHDHVRPALEALGVTQSFWGVALRPGKPTWFGVLDRDEGEPRRTLVFGLPGNPVSAMVTFILFARPALLAMAGRSPGATRTTATLAAPYDEKKPGRAHAVRCRLEISERGWRATPTGAQGSHVLTSMLGADGLAIVPTGAGPLDAGESVEIELLSHPLT